MNYHRLIYLFILLISHLPSQLTSATSRDELYLKGEESYGKLKPSQNSYAGSKCMEEAFSQLNATCSTLDDEIALGFLALKFTLCHYQASMRDLPRACSSDVISKSNESITNCTRSMEDSAFLVYTQFYTHTRASCYYLEEKLWQQRTDNTISRLSDVAEESASKIQESLSNNEELLRGQEAILDRTSELNEQQDSMQTKLDENHSKMDLLSKEIGDYYTMANDIFSKVSLSLSRVEQMVKIVLGETQQLSSFLFYVILIVSTFILTFPMRTSKARMKILGVTLLHFLFEKLVFSLTYSLAPQHSGHVMGILYYTRFIIVLTAVVILIHTGYHYNDYEKLLISIGTKLDQERLENEKFREDIRNEMKINTSSIHDNFNEYSTPPKPVSNPKQKFPTRRHSINRSRKRLDSYSYSFSSDSNSEPKPPPDTCQSSDVESEIVLESAIFTPLTSLDYDSGVEDCVSKKELHIDLPKFDLSSYYSPRSSPYYDVPLKSTPSHQSSTTESPYNLRARK